jgi:hypothetical protein
LEGLKRLVPRGSAEHGSEMTHSSTIKAPKDEST